MRSRFSPERADVGSAVCHVLSRAALLAALGFIIGYVHQRFDGLRSLRRTWIYAQLERLPRLESAVWRCTWSTSSSG